MNQPMTIGCLALRGEDAMWNAYYMLPDRTEGAMFLGSIHLSAILDNDTRKAQFVQLMQAVVNDIITQATGHVPQWDAPREADTMTMGGRGARPAPNGDDG